MTTTPREVEIERLAAALHEDESNIGNLGNPFLSLDAPPMTETREAPTRYPRTCLWPMGDEDDAPPCGALVPWQRSGEWMVLCDGHEIEWHALVARLAAKGATVEISRG